MIALYNLLLLILGGLCFPKLKRGCLFFRPPSLKREGDQPLFWIHAVSVGETRAAFQFVNLLHKDHPEAMIIFSCVTKTGLEEGKRLFPFAKTHFILPYDFFWNAKRLVKFFKPTLFIQVESDFWLNLLRELKRENTKTALINGKISVKAMKRHTLFPWFAKRLFSHFDFISLQSAEYVSLFTKFCAQPLYALGNLKFDTVPPQLSHEEKLSLKKRYNLEKKILVIGSSHEGEEELLLDALKNLEEYQVVLAPRHPERFEAVASLIEQKGEKCARLSRKEPAERYLLVDEMGELNSFYQIADVALVAGSFVPKVGGHNILEPMFFGVPTLFGPYMEAQGELKRLAQLHNAGKEVQLDQLKTLLASPEELKTLGEAGYLLTQSLRGASEKTYNLLKKSLWGCEKI